MLEGKVALVTGSTSGIGLGIARSLAAHGCDVMLNGFGDADSIAAVRQEMASAHGVRVEYHPADLSTAAGCAALVAATEAALGGIDILVNNAGIQHVAPIDSFPVDRWDAIIAVNLSSAFHTIRGALPGMKERGWGRIINIASVHGLVASAEKAAYVAAKHGVVGLTKVVALEVARLPITCNAICPGWVDTPLVQIQIGNRARALGVPHEDGARDLLREKQPSLRFTSIEQLGQTAVFLCSDAAANITGVSLPVDGGWTSQ